MTTFGAASEENVVKYRPFPFQCEAKFTEWRNAAYVTPYTSQTFLSSQIMILGEPKRQERW